MKIKQGDPVRVRLATGEVVDAVYYSPADYDKCHWVQWGGRLLLAVGGLLMALKARSSVACRFVGPTPMVKKENNND